MLNGDWRDVPQQVVLLVDDNERYRSMLTRAMRGMGFACLEAGDGAAGLAILETHPEIVLVMADIQMPVMDGVTMLHAIRARWPQTAVMMVSGLDDEAVALQCVTMGAMDYIQKPFDVQQLRLRVPRVLEYRRKLMEDNESAGA